MTLRGRTILVTREPDRSAGMVREIESRGGTAVVVPMIVTGPPASWAQCDDALSRFASFEMIVFTSARAVEAFVARARHAGIPPGSLSRLRCAAVGSATASVLSGYGVQVAVLPEKFSGASLASAMGRSVRGERVLIPRGNIAREEVAESLRRAGAIVETVTVYETSAPAGIAPASFARRVLSGEFDVLTFASPSAAENFAALFRPGELAGVPDHAKVAVIGPATADAVRGLGLTVDIIARESTGAGLIRSIEEFYS
ncbi:MAG TPA: uroporphyrinogen-III synthase [Bacteroidota bacterium]|nr:uroporphyrinogen-III synthase [Bacteroidota bacterium]